MRKKVRKSAKEEPVINVVWAEGLTDKDVKILREQVEQALKDPDYTIISNYEVHWDRIHVDKSAVARVVYADEIDEKEVDALRDQVDKALTDPDYVIVTNYPVIWNEISK